MMRQLLSRQGWQLSEAMSLEEFRASLVTAGFSSKMFFEVL